MAYPNRQSSAAVIAKGQEFFYTLWRLLKENPAALEEIILFRTQPELKFFGRDVTRINQQSQAHGVSYEVWVNFMGLIGAHGTLPAYFKETLLAQSHQSDHPMHLIYDWLQQRSFQLLYDGWLKRRVFMSSLKPQPFTHLLASLSGMTEVHPWQHDLYTTYLHYFTAHFANPRRTVAALQQILTTVLQQTVEIMPLQGAWLPIPTEQQSVLGDTQLANLGSNVIIGARVWVPEAKLKIVISLTDATLLFAFFPGGKQHQLIQQLVSRYATGHYQWELQLQIDNVAIQACCLGTMQWNSLGRASFLGGIRQSGIYSAINLGDIS